VVDSDYDGPHLQGPITLDFVVQMIEHFKKQKRLHKKYVHVRRDASVSNNCVGDVHCVLTAVCDQSRLVFVGA
jgi:hypothetical protein